MSSRSKVFLSSILIVAILASTQLAKCAPKAIVAEWEAARIWDIDLTNAQASNPRPSTPKYLMDIEFDDTGKLYGLAGQPGGAVGLYHIDLNSGASSLIGNVNTAQEIYEGDLAWDSTTQTMFAVQGLPTLSVRNLLTWNTVTGAVTVIGSLTPNGGDFSAMSLDGAGNLYALETQQDQIWKINKATAQVVSITPIHGNIGNGAGMDWDSSTGKMYVYDGVLPTLPSNLYELNVSTGDVTLIGSNGMQNGTGIAFLPIPEPSSACVLLTVIILVLFKQQRWVRERSRS